LKNRKASGFIIFSSGSTGRAKAILHEADRFLAKFENAGKAFRTLTFLLFDHIAGLDTLFYGLASGGTVVFPDNRDPVSVARLMQDTRVEVLPASPTFLRLFCLSEEAGRFDLSSLKIITHGSEPMDSSTLNRLRERFPGVQLIQKYGTSEFGAPRSKSRGDGSLWMKLSGEGFSVCVRDGVLWVRADAAMLGYLNVPPPKIENGWMCTGDSVEVDGEWIRILGRQSDLIIVGGEKVFPAEVEETILELPQFQEAKVWGEKHALIGQIVCAAVVVAKSAIGDDEALRIIRSHCGSKLARYKVPVKVCVSQESLVGSRHKMSRLQEAVL
jgi:acyl-CoA synthetase (AMP-forming)/AMP-acid ligase II